MSINPSALYSITAMISTSLIGFCIFIFSRKHFSSTSGPFFKNHILGFSLLGLGFLFHLFINLNQEMKYPFYLTVFLSSQLAIIVAHALFLRGTLLLDTKGRFLTAIFPLIAMPIGAALAMSGLILAKVSSFMMFTILKWGFTMPIKAFLASIFLYYFFKGSTFDTVKGKFHTVFLGSIWLVSLGMDAYLWFTLVHFQEFWSIKLASLTNWYFLRAIVYWLTLAAILIYSRYLNRLGKSAKAE